MEITWLGHSGFRIVIEQTVLLVDPWLTGNPMFPQAQRDQALEGATHVLLTHAHGDHPADAAAIAKEKGIAVCCIHEVSESAQGDGSVRLGRRGACGDRRGAGAGGWCGRHPETGKIGGPDRR